MASQLESTMDAPVTTSDSTSGSTALINEVNNDRAANKTTDTKANDQTAANKVNDTFGTLTISDDSKDTSAAAKATGDASGAGAAAAASDASTTDASTSKPAADTTDASAAKTDTLSVAAPADSTKAAAPSDATAAVTSVDATNAVTADVSAAKSVDSTSAVTSTDAVTATTPVDSTTATPSDSSAVTTPADSTATKDAPGANGDGTKDVAKAPDAADVNADALKKIQDDPQVKAEAKKLNDDITKHEKGLDKSSDEYQRLETMRTNMDVLEKRAASQNPPLGPEEVAKTFKGVSHIIDAKDGPNVLPQADRMDVAQEAMLHAADPTTIDQGMHETCNVTTVESRMFTKNPSAAVSLIDQVSTTGKYTTPDGSQTVTVNPDSLKRTGTEEKKSTPEDGDRSYASQIFQVTAVNLAHQTHDFHVKDEKGNDVTYPAGTVEYRQGKPDENATPPTSGEVLVDKRTGKPILDGGKEIHAPSLKDDSIVDCYNQISDHKDSGFYICNKDNVDGDGKQVTQIGSEAELKAKILEAQKDGKLPIILGVNSGQEPFYSDSHGGAAGGSGGGHVVTITGIDKDGKVQVENQWGKESKHSVDMHELYIATMLPKDAITELKKDAAQNAKDGKVDFATEAELLRLRHSSGDLQGKESEYKEQLTWLTKEAVKDAIDNKGGKLDNRTELELQNMLAPYDQKGNKDWDRISDQVWADPLHGIMDGSGQVGLDDQGKKTVLPADYDKLQMDRDAKSLYDAGNQTLYFNQKDYDQMDRALQYKSPAEIKQMDAEFQAKYGKSMEQYIKDEFKRHPEQRDKALKLLHQAQTGDENAAA